GTAVARPNPRGRPPPRIPRTSQGPATRAGPSTWPRARLLRDVDTALGARCFEGHEVARGPRRGARSEERCAMRDARCDRRELRELRELRKLRGAAKDRAQSGVACKLNMRC